MYRFVREVRAFLCVQLWFEFFTFVDNLHLTDFYIDCFLENNIYYAKYGPSVSIFSMAVVKQSYTQPRGFIFKKSCAFGWKEVIGCSFYGGFIINS